MSDAQTSEAFRKVEQTLKDGGFDFQTGDYSTFYITMDDAPYAGAVAQVIEAENRFVFYVEFRAVAPEKQYAPVAEFVTRANWGLLIGNFEFSYDQGITRYKSSLDFGDAPLTADLIKHAIVAARDVCEIYADALQSVIAGESGAKAAIEKAEA